jgi:dTDP-4-dehydrorhamnose reductase
MAGVMFFTNSFSDWLHTELRARRKVKVFVDQYRTPIYAVDAVMAIDELISKDVKNEIFNLGGSEKFQGMSLHLNSPMFSGIQPI